MVKDWERIAVGEGDLEIGKLLEGDPIISKSSHEVVTAREGTSRDSEDSILILQTYHVERGSGSLTVNPEGRPHDIFSDHPDYGHYVAKLAEAREL